MEEIWKDIPGYENVYQASNLGNIKSLDRLVKYQNGRSKRAKGKILVGSFGGGYLAVGLFCVKDRKMKRHLIHRLVALTFIPNPENKRTVNHINMIKTDNRLCNLEWNTYSENAIHSFKNNPLRTLSHRGENANSGKLKNDDVFKIRQMIEDKIMIKDIAKLFKVNRMAISHIKRGISWTHI